MSDLDVIQEIEKSVGKELEPCPSDKYIMDYYQEGRYLLNPQQQVIGLNLKGFELEKIDFLSRSQALAHRYLHNIIHSPKSYRDSA
jgi:hypothetical protein